MKPLTIIVAAAIVMTVAPAAMARDRSRPPKPLDDIAQWFGGDSYPPAALRQQEEGRVSAMLFVDDAGKVTDCRITESSGFADLDRATCAFPMHRARFEPARDPRGKPVAGTYPLHGIRWQLPPEPPTIREEAAAPPPSPAR